MKTVIECCGKTFEANLETFVKITTREYNGFNTVTRVVVERVDKKCSECGYLYEHYDWENSLREKI